MRKILLGVACIVALAPIVEGATTPFLDFPLSCPSATQGKCSSTRYSKGAYTPASMTSVLDHHMEKPYDEDGIVTAFTGEEGRATAAKPKVNQGCYPQYSPIPGKPFIIKGLYIGTDDGCLADQGLNYDNHPAYDYVAEIGTPVYAAASGRVVKIVNKATGLPGRCVPKGIETGGCGIWGYVGIDHGNGYVTQYGHLSRVDVQSGDEIKAGALIGLTGQSSPPKKDKNGNVTKLYSVPPHLHFEVLKENAGSPYGYAFVDPYGWEGEPRSDPLARATGIPNVRLWKTEVQANATVPKVSVATNSIAVAEKEAERTGYDYLAKMITKCDGLAYLKSKHTSNDGEQITDIREYKGAIKIDLHERPSRDPKKGMDWGGAFEVNAPRERMNYRNGGWTVETPMPLLFTVAKVHGQWQADSGFQKVTCDEVQRLRTNPTSTGVTPTTLLSTNNAGKDDIRKIDFLNFSYRPTLCNEAYGKEGIGKVVQVRNGKFDNKRVDYGIVGNKVIYGDLTGDSASEAIVHTNCWQKGANFGLSEIQIFTLQNGQALLLANINDNDRQRDYRRYYPNGSLWFGLTGTGSDVKIIGGNVIIEQVADGPHCCPESIVTLAYRWNGKQFVLSKPPQKRRYQ